MKSSRTIVVVGAGAAGLCAAATLAAAGWPVVVLEARRRVGGRIFTRRVPGLPLPIELGAEFVHGAAPVTRRLLRAARIGEHEMEGGHVELRDGAARRRAYWPALDRLLRRVDRRAPDRSFADFLSGPEGSELTADERAMASGFVQGFHAADPARISLHSIAPREDEVPSADVARAARLPGGYDALPRSLAAQLGEAVRLAHVVRRIAWRPGEIELTVTHAGHEQTLRARAAVVTVPLGVLQAGGLELEPLPPRWERALARLAMGSAMGVNMALRDSPWSGRADLASAVRRAAYLHTPGGFFNVWFTAEPFDAAQLVAWSGGPPAASLLREGKAAVLSHAVSELARASGIGEPALRRNLLGAWVHDWDRDRWSRGAYSYALVGGAEAGRDLARPVDGTLFLAGEATVSDGSNGTVEGALASGVRAARQVMRVMRHSAR